MCGFIFERVIRMMAKSRFKLIGRGGGGGDATLYIMLEGQPIEHQSHTKSC